MIKSDAKALPGSQQGNLKAEPEDTRRPVVDVARWLDEQGRARLLHNGELYELRVTRNNRLILNK